tara:strand:+ start:704 stop:889 length:186 start_codon:yes stop_codon:yes gene_type:complete
VLVGQVVLETVLRVAVAAVAVAVMAVVAQLLMVELVAFMVEVQVLLAITQEIGAGLEALLG